MKLFLAKLYNFMLEAGDPYGWVPTLTKAMKNIVAPILGVIAAVGVLYAVWIAIKMARADNAEQREEAKKKLIWVLVAVAVMIVLMVFFLALFPMIMEAVFPEIPVNEYL